MKTKENTKDRRAERELRKALKAQNEYLEVLSDDLLEEVYIDDDDDL